MAQGAVDLIGDLYEAAAGGRDWLAVSRKLCQLMGAENATLSLDQEQGGARNLLRPFDASEASYLNYYRKIDPIRASAARVFSSTQGPAVRMEREFVSEANYLRSEFYADYARQEGQQFSIVGAIGDEGGTLIGFFRDAKGVAFSERERDLLVSLIPHLRRALQLRKQFSRADDVGGVEFAKLDHWKTGCIVVNSDMYVVFANQASLKIIENRSAGLMIMRAGPWLDTAPRLLVARRREDGRALKALVADAANGGHGGAIRIRNDLDHEGSTLSLVALVLSVWTRAGAKFSSPGLASGLAKIVLRDIQAPMRPDATLFQNMFGLSVAEAAVAVALLGGRTAEDVARLRQVSLDTIRSQIRTVLRKSEAANLRDFERIGAMLGSMPA